MQGVSRPGGFDPLAGLYVARHARPAGIEPVDAGELTPFQRALLAIDGTVTSFLEAWSLEAVRVERLWQYEVQLDAADPWLEADTGETVWRRAVTLRGAGSGSVHAFAESVICPGRLPPAMRAELDAGVAGVGQILLARGLDSRREGLWYGRERPVLPEALRSLEGRDFLTRTYRVTTAGRPLMLITERFPWIPAIVAAGREAPPPGARPSDPSEPEEQSER